MTRPRVPRVGRPYVTIPTALLLDDDLAELSDSARLAYFLLLLHSAGQGHEGKVSTSIKRLNTILNLDGERAAAEQAVKELIEAGKLEVNEGGDSAYITDWDRTQADLVGSRSRSPQAIISQNIRRHREGYHKGDDYVEECQSCQKGWLSPCDEAGNAIVDAPAVVEAPPAAEPAAPAQLALVEVPETDDVLVIKGTKDLLALLRSEMPAVFEDYPRRLDAYKFLWSKILPSLIERFGHLSNDVPGTLRNALLTDAMDFYRGDVKPEQYAAACRSAKALDNKDGWMWWILALDKSAAKTVDDPVAYIATIAAKLRSEHLRGAA